MKNDGRLELIKVLNAGEANKEAVAIQVLADTNLAGYGLIVGYSNGFGGITPYNDNFFWFGSTDVRQNDWIFVYTGSGIPASRLDPKDGSSIHTFFWGKRLTQFASNRVAPILFSFGAVLYDVPPADQVQYALPTIARE